MTLMNVPIPQSVRQANRICFYIPTLNHSPKKRVAYIIETYGGGSPDLIVNLVR